MFAHGIVYEMPGQTVRVVSTNAVKTLDTLVGGESLELNGRMPKAAVITIETNDIRVGFHTDPSRTGGSELGHVHKEGDYIILQSAAAVRHFRFTSKTADAAAVLQITGLY